MKKINFTLLALFIFLGSSYSQDIHFSQMDNSPLNLNPALVGEFKGKGRVILNYRNQWQNVTINSFRTYALTSDCAFSKGRFAAGISVFKDVAGDANMSNTQVNLTVASKEKVTNDDFLKVGIQASVSQHQMEMSQLTWNSQYDGMSINPNMSSGEQIGNQSYHVFDFASGVIWTHIKDRQKLFSIGLSAYHVTQPLGDFLSNQSKLTMRYNAHADVAIQTTRELGIYPSAVFLRQGSSQELDLGGVVKYNMGNNSKYTGIMKSSSLYLGLYYRYKDAIILYSRINMQKTLDLCFSYDVNVSRLNVASHMRGGAELSLIYTIPEGPAYNVR